MGEFRRAKRTPLWVVTRAISRFVNCGRCVGPSVVRRTSDGMTTKHDTRLEIRLPRAALSLTHWPA
jgi:hypothetical protein